MHFLAVLLCCSLVIFNTNFADSAGRYDKFNGCGNCLKNAVSIGARNGVQGYVGTSCLVGQYACRNRRGGIHSMYPANGWFYLQCAPSGAWCMPCSTRNLIYNPNSGACVYRNGK